MLGKVILKLVRTPPPKKGGGKGTVVLKKELFLVRDPKHDQTIGISMVLLSGTRTTMQLSNSFCW